jgi:hypothetical protein
VHQVVGVQGPFTLMTNFPRHVFADEEYALTLRDLQLCPSATLILTVRTQSPGRHRHAHTSLLFLNNN